MQQAKTQPKPIHYFDLGGKTRPVRYGFRAQREAAEALGTEHLSDFETINERIGLRELPQFLFYGLQDGARKEKMPFDATVEDVEDWLDDYDGPILGGEDGLLARVLMAFSDAYQQTPGEMKNGVDPKSAVGNGKKAKTKSP